MTGRIRPRRGRRRSFDGQVLRLCAVGAGVPYLALTVTLLAGGHDGKTVTTVLLVTGLVAAGCAWAVRERLVHALHTIGGLLSALREGDFSVRARGARRDDPLDDVHAEINALAEALQSQRFSAVEATTLLRRVLEEIEVAIFTFDEAGVVRLVNPAGARLLGQPAERIAGRPASALGLAPALEGGGARTFEAAFPGGRGRWGLRRSSFREGGRPLQLLVLADLDRALRAEEAAAWQKLVRVLGHELNNSLAPIKSIAGSLLRLARAVRRPDDWEDDLRGGLDIIAQRTDSLTRFMSAYAQLARLPPPERAPTDVGALVQRVVRLDYSSLARAKPADAEAEAGPWPQPVVEPGPEVTLSADAAQLEQVLINLAKNAVEASAETGGGVRLRWRIDPGEVRIEVEDEGPGIANPSNLFVPFFTTKSRGTGIGLVLSRNIAENHGGRLTLANRDDGRGALARLTLPLAT